MRFRQRRIGWVLAAFAALAVVAVAGASPVSAAGTSARHIQVRFHEVNDSGVSGIVDLRQQHSGANISVVAFVLNPGDHYLSLDYSNHVCELEPYAVTDVIGGIYIAYTVDVGTTLGQASDVLANINSVSVRKADFALVTCANVHPGA
jgi:hypothetical protein